ncbi:hypothetical protein ACTVPS_01840 [Serratia marcescens]
MNKFSEVAMLTFIYSTIAGFGFAGGAMAFWGWIKFLGELWR